uniref:Glycosyltransferase RgtA/B/C/D-like domain-containing protein n=1 Tax=Solibacter usitatus (strain Ellin6076) TaxID=234267 RepID=Q01TU4_SOLUE
MASGRPLYGTRPERLATNYPPLSFHLEAALGRVTGDFNLAGRLISIAAFLWVAICCGLAVRIATGDSTAAIFAVLFCIAWFTPFAPYNVGVNDPQMLGHALMLTGVVLYLAAGRSARLLAVSCVFFCLGGFTKHSLLAFPLAVTFDILLRSRRRFVLWAATAAVTCALLTALTLWVDGPYVLQHLLSPRRYLLSRATFISATFLRIYTPGLLVGATWCFTAARRSKARFLAFALPLSLITGAIFAGGAGVAVNIFYDAWIVSAIIAALVLSGAAAGAAPGSFRWFAAMLLIPLLFSALPIAAGLYTSIPPSDVLAREDRVFAEDIAFLKSRPGPAICFDLLLCHQAGKTLSYEPFVTGELIATGHLDPAVVAAELASRKYAVIQSDQGITYFSPTILDALNSHYRIDRQSSRSVFYVPVE